MFNLYSLSVVLLSFTVVISHASDDIQYYVYLNATEEEVCFSIPDVSDNSTQSTLEVILYVAYTTTTVEAGVSFLDVSHLEDGQEHILKYNHLITRSTHDLEVWIDGVPQTFKKTTQSRFYYISEFYDVLLIASPSVNLSCSHENITRTLQQDYRSEIADEPWNDLPRMNTISSEETGIEEATQKPEYKEVLLENEDYDTDAEVIEIDPSVFPTTLERTESKNDSDVSWVDDGTKSPETDSDDYYVESDTEEPVVEIEESSVSQEDPVTETVMDEIEATVIESSDIHDELEERKEPEVFVQQTTTSSTTASPILEPSNEPNDVIKDTTTTTSEATSPLTENEVVADDNEPPEGSSTEETISEKETLKPVDEVIYPEEVEETESMISESQDYLLSVSEDEAAECKACSGESNKAHVTVIIVLVVILGGIFVAAIVVSIVFHRKKKKFEFPRASRSRDRKDELQERPMFPREGEKLIKIQSQKV